MSTKRYTLEEAYRLLSLTDESDGETLSADSSGTDFDPVESSGSLSSSSDDEVMVPARVRRTRPRVIEPQVPQDQSQGQQSGASADLGIQGEAYTSSAAHPGPIASTAVPPGEVASTRRAVQAGMVASAVTSPSQPPQRTQARRAPSIPEVLANPNWQPPDSAAPVLPPFTAQSGLRVETANLESPLDFFQLFFNAELCDLVVAETNRYATQYLTANPDCYYAQPFRWRPVNASELKTFLGLLLNMGLTAKNVLRSYWSTDPIHHMPVFSAAMSRARFEIILRFLHFSDNTTCHPRGHPAFDRLHKIRPLVDHFTSRFADLYTPEQNICVDESLIHFTGRLGIKQYIPSKRARYGVKLYKLCERATGYTYSFRVYEGKDSKLEPVGCPDYLGCSGKIVWDLVSPLFGKGYHLFVDNFYTSVPLFRHLFLHQIGCCGTVRPNRRGFPLRLITTRLERGERIALRDEELLAVKWKDKRDVYMLSTIHADTTIEHSRASGVIDKPLAVHAYNQNMGGVDFNDQMLAPYLVARRTRHWYKKVSIYLIQLALYNSFVLFSKAGRHGSFLKFQEAIIRSLLYPGGAIAQPPQDVVSRLHQRHQPGVLPGRTPNNRTPRKLCRVCRRRGLRRDTSACCLECPGRPALCPGECFRRYHTYLHF